MLERLGLNLPIIQAPMAGVSTPELAAAVSNAGALGSIGVGATDAAGAGAMIAKLRARTDRAFNVNLFVHRSPVPDPSREAAWLSALDPTFRAFGAKPPTTLRTIYRSFAEDEAMLRLLIATKPPMVSFHFGLPDGPRIAALKEAGCHLVATVTNLAEAQAARRAGIDALVAQGIEAGGHRGCFDENAADDCLGTMPLVRILASQSGLPVIAAGGIMDGRGIGAALRMGAIAAQLGTAFIGCPESAADEAYRSALFATEARHTVMTRAISGRPARCLRNRFTILGDTIEAGVPDYPIAYDAGKALNLAAKAAGESGFGAQWAGQGAPLARTLPAADLVARLAAEMAG
ncbi:nitronate monooxygenase [Novosphingobium sp. ZN18A2]|uniref:NAD(P)H-dependent flavin oxidoreductase n=1 Tax=Novosphingobium sp. ZN18A2 TaxID=3079861 RepID=UPI0030D5E21A